MGILGLGISRDPDNNATNGVGDGAVTLNSDAAIVTLGAAQAARRLIVLSGSAPLGFYFPRNPGALWIVRNDTGTNAPVATAGSTPFDLAASSTYLVWVNEAGLLVAAVIVAPG